MFMTLMSRQTEVKSGIQDQNLENHIKFDIFGNAPEIKLLEVTYGTFSHFTLFDLV